MGQPLGNTTFQCINCRLAQRAEVRVISLPEAPNRRGQARRDANTRAAMLLALKRCPRCGHYDRNVASNNRHNLRVVAGLYMTLVIAVSLTLYAIPAIPQLAAAITMFVLVLGFLALYRHLRQKFPSEAESRVTLIGQHSVNQQWW